MPLYTFCVNNIEVEVFATDPESAEQFLKDINPGKRVLRNYMKPAGVIFKKTTGDRGTTRKSTWRKPGA